jgi:hypothetical protein
MPGRFRSIICASHQRSIFKHAGECDAHDVPSRIAAGVSKSANLLEANGPQAGFFGEFPGGRVFEREMGRP